MIGAEPTYPWTEYRVRVEDIKAKDPKLAKFDFRYVMFKLKPEAPDDVKLKFEKAMNVEYASQADVYTPELKEPYYTWEGKIVERDSLKGRKLPLVKIGGEE